MLSKAPNAIVVATGWEESLVFLILHLNLLDFPIIDEVVLSLVLGDVCGRRRGYGGRLVRVNFIEIGYGFCLLFQIIFGNCRLCRWRRDKFVHDFISERHFIVCDLFSFVFVELNSIKDT